MTYKEYTYEALRWLRQRTHPCALGPNHEGIDGWNTQKAIALVQAFYAAGSTDVRVVNPLYDDLADDLMSDLLTVKVPRDSTKRAAIFAVYAQAGFLEPEQMMYQGELSVFYD